MGQIGLLSLHTEHRREEHFMGVLEGVSRMTLSVYRLYPNGEREDIKAPADFELGDASRWLPQTRSRLQGEPPTPATPE
ncbi:hypothetical protein [Embleya sp. AB8]|uniref:hypothetical protein n=1 Tax=Embleya sp. AB8 TaxID=3156304 RepID=UPI003C72088D